MSCGDDVGIVPAYSENRLWNATYTVTLRKIVTNFHLLHNVDCDQSVWPINTFIDDEATS